MGNYTREEILQMVEDECVVIIRIKFNEMFWSIKNIDFCISDLYLIHLQSCRGVHSREK